MKRAAIVVAVLAVLAGIAWLVVLRINAAPPPGTLFGNIDIRQVDLAFNSEGTVSVMHKREGDAVTLGETLASLDDTSYRQAEALSAARRDAAQAQLDKLVHGTRPEDIDQARANVAAAKATLADAQVTFERQQALVKTNVAQTEAALAEAVAGPRAEDIAAARAQLRESEAALELSRTQLARAVLKSPCDGIIMTRVVEPGTVVLPNAAIYSVAITGEVWVRAFVPEAMLGRVAPDTAVLVLTDSRPNRPYHGRIGYVSPAAEFTPKTVETPELRTQLVYRIRIRITDPDPGIRQGQPVTIRLPEAKPS